MKSEPTPQNEMWSAMGKPTMWLIKSNRSQLIKSNISLSYIKKFTSLLEKLLGWTVDVKLQNSLWYSCLGEVVTWPWLPKLKRKFYAIDRARNTGPPWGYTNNSRAKLRASRKQTTLLNMDAEFVFSVYIYRQGFIMSRMIRRSNAWK